MYWLSGVEQSGKYDITLLQRSFKKQEKATLNPRHHITISKNIS